MVYTILYNTDFDYKGNTIANHVGAICVIIVNDFATSYIFPVSRCALLG